MEKQKDIKILAIESSCDETAAAVVKNGREVLSNIISSQIDLHTLYGGVVPEIASRKHIEKINQVIEEALKEAYKAYNKGETPIGAVIVKDGQIISRDHNLTETLKDSTAHAEILAIKQASESLGGWRLTNCDLYVTMEPCIMCSGAIVNSRIKNIIIGTKHINNSKMEKQHRFKLVYYKDNSIDVTFGILKDECSDVLQKFFKNLRNKD